MGWLGERRLMFVRFVSRRRDGVVKLKMQDAIDGIS